MPRFTRDLTSTMPASAGSHANETLSSLLRSVEAPVGRTRRLALPRLVLYAVALLVMLMLVWAALARVDRVVRTEGRVVPSGKQQLVQHLEGGIVTQLFVREGDTVRAGDNLIAVSALAADASRGEKQARINGLLARAARLTAEAEGAAAVTVPTELDRRAPEVASELEAFSARQARLSQTTRILEEQAQQKAHEVAEIEGRRRGLNEELDVARQQLTLVERMIARGAASQLELLEARGRVERLRTQMLEADNTIPRVRSAAQEISARLAETRAQFRSEARSALTEAKVELSRLREELRADVDRVARTVVTAPVGGTVNKIYANTVGGVVKPGETLVELTPSDTGVVMEVRASPADRGPLQVGQKAVVRVAAFDYTVHGTVDATIREISADSIADERGDRYFRVSLSVDPSTRVAFDKPLSPGMTVTADVVTGDRTVLQYLMSPVRGLASTAFRDRS